MLKTKTVNYIACDICGREVEEAEKEATWCHTCSACGKQVCERHARKFRCEEDSSYFTLCMGCLKDFNITNEKTGEKYGEE